MNQTELFLGVLLGGDGGEVSDQPCPMVLGGLPTQDIFICYVAVVKSLSLSEPVKHGEWPPSPIS